MASSHSSNTEHFSVNAGLQAGAATTAAPGPWHVRSLAARALSVIAPVRPAEVGTVLLLTVNVMVLLGAYYLLKTAREPLILQGGAAVKTYASALQALLLIPVAHAFGRLSARLGPLRLAAVVNGFFTVNLLLFWAMSRAGVGIGVVFYVWVGVFNMTALAHFWTVANDVFELDQGRRVFALLGVGAAVGGWLGARFAGLLYRLVGVSGLLLVAAVLLMLALGFTALVLGRRHHGADSSNPTVALREEGSGLDLLLHDRYLQLIAALMVLLNVVNTTGEYMLDRTLVAAAHAQAAVPPDQFIASFKADFFGWVNVIGMGLQFLVVSRVMRHLGVGAGLFVLPLIALGGYAALSVLPALSLIFLAKVAENGVNYSLQSTVRQALFLPTSREVKYKAKSLIDTVVVRAGDVGASLLVLLGQRLGFEVRTFAALNAVVAIAWLVVVWHLARRHQEMVAGRGARSAPAAFAYPRGPLALAPAARPSRA